jgi:hypothetical protein
MRVSKFVVLLSMGVVIWFSSASAWAATPVAVDNSFNLTTSPLPINLAGPPGSTLTADIRVKNGGTATEKLKVTLMKFSAYGEAGKPAIADRGPGDSYFDWVSFSPQTFDAQPNVWQTVKMTIKLPKTAAFGYYYAAAFSLGSPPPQASGKQNIVLGSTAVLVLVDAQAPGEQRAASVTSFTADHRFYEFLPATFTVKLHNSGNIHLIPTGNIFISKGGKAVATLGVNTALGNILPGTNRIFTSNWNDGFPRYVTKQANGNVVLDKNGKPVTSLQWDFSRASKLKFGHYKAHLTMAYDNGQRDVPMEAEVSFWVVPWRVLAASLVVLVFVGVGLWSTGGKVVRKLRKIKK